MTHVHVEVVKSIKTVAEESRLLIKDYPSFYMDNLLLLDNGLSIN